MQPALIYNTMPTDTRIQPINNGCNRKKGQHAGSHADSVHCLGVYTRVHSHLESHLHQHPPRQHHTLNTVLQSSQQDKQENNTPIEYFTPCQTHPRTKSIQGPDSVHSQPAGAARPPRPRRHQRPRAHTTASNPSLHSLGDILHTQRKAGGKGQPGPRRPDAPRANGGRAPAPPPPQPAPRSSRACQLDTRCIDSAQCGGRREAPLEES